MPFCFWTDSLVTANAFFLFVYFLFLKRKYQRKQFGICWFAKQSGQASPRVAKVSRNPLKSSRRDLSATSALPEQRRKRSSNLESFLIVRSFCACGDGAQQLPSSLRKVAFSKENDGRSSQGETCRNHQGGNFPQTPFIYLYVLSFLKRKYERKQFRRHILLKDHL